MTLILSGTDGLSDVDGTAATPALRGTDANTGIFFPAADTIAFAEGGAEVARFDSAANMGVGTNSPSTYADGFGPVLVTGTGNNFATVQGRTDGPSGAANGVSYGGSYATNAINGARMFLGAAGSGGQRGIITFNTKDLDDNSTQPLERMRIAADGTWMLNTTDVDAFIGSSTSQTGFSFRPGLAPRISLVNDFYINRSNGNGNIFEFRRNGSAVGTITVSAGATAYNTSSDYRLKEAIAPMTGALAKVALLKPCTYKWKADGSDGQGFIAHELAEVVPDCVTGEKDAVEEEQYEVTPAVKDEEGRVITEAVMGTRTVPVYQGVDVSFLVATLTAAIQELKAIVDTQAARITALESAP